VKFHRIEAASRDVGFAIYATIEVVKFLEGLDAESGQKVIGLIEQVAAEGPPWNREKSKKLFDDIYELKSYQVRLAYVYGSRRRTILLIHGIRKKSDEWPKGEKKVAKRVRAEVLDASEKGTIEYVD
jgi:phage-related protein